MNAKQSYEHLFTQPSENILSALLKIIYALNGDAAYPRMPAEISDIIKGNNDFNDNSFLSFNIIKALDAIAESIHLKQELTAVGPGAPLDDDFLS